MAEIRIERRRSLHWLPWTAMAALFAIALLFMVTPARLSGDYDPAARPGFVFNHEGRALSPADPALATRLDDAGMRVVAQQDGVRLYAPAGGGGGAGAPRYYVRVGDDRYVPMTPR